MNKKIVSTLSLMSFVMFQLSAKPMSFASTNPGVSGWVKAVLITVGACLALYCILIFVFDCDFFLDLLEFSVLIIIFAIGSFFVFPTIWCGLIGIGIASIVYVFFIVILSDIKKRKEAKENKHEAHLFFERYKDYFLEVMKLVGGEENIASISIGEDHVEVELKTRKSNANNNIIVKRCKEIKRYTFDGILLTLYSYNKRTIHDALELAMEETRAEKEAEKEKERQKEEDERRMKNQLKEQRDGVLAQQKETEQQREEENRQSQLEKLIKKVEDAVLLFQSSVDKKESVNLQLLKMIEDALSEIQSCKNILEKHDKEELKRNKKYCKTIFREAKKLEGFTQSANVRMDEILKMFDDVAK